jgi:hypothetical protein
MVDSVGREDWQDPCITENAHRKVEVLSTVREFLVVAAHEVPQPPPAAEARPGQCGKTEHLMNVFALVSLAADDVFRAVELVVVETTTDQFVVLKRPAHCVDPADADDVVVVHERERARRGCGYAYVSHVAQVVAIRRLDEPNPVVFVHELADDVGRVVGRFVVHDDQLPPAVSDLRREGGQLRAKIVSAVERGEDDR